MTTVDGKRRWSPLDFIELAACFVLFSGLMHFLYLGPVGVSEAERGLPGHDSYYHVRMAALLPELGLVDQFPWLRTTVFNERFVNHHYGFQALLSPFVGLSHRLTGDHAPGGRWFMTLSFGVSMALVNLLLMIRGVERRWIWLLLCLLLPIQFYQRHLYVRAISPSLICMLLMCLSLFTRRFVWAGVVLAVSIHLYLGAVMYGPALAGIVFISGLIGRLGDRGGEKTPALQWRDALRGFWGWRLIAWTAAGWVVGLATHPYGGREVLGFLDLQVFGSGLSPDIPVGQEWQSYTPAWFFVNMSGVTLTVLGVALAVRLRVGPRLDTNETALFVMNLLFLVLTLKARRFIEYWPVFAMLTSAHLVGSMGARRGRIAGVETSGDGGVGLHVAKLGAALGCFCVVFVGARASLSMYSCGAFLAEWRLWTILASLCAIAPIVRTCGRVSGAGARVSFAAGTGFTLLVGIVLNRLAVFAQAPDARVWMPWWLFILPLAAYPACRYWFAMSGGGTSVPEESETIGAHAHSRFQIWSGLVASILIGVAAVTVVVPPAGTFFSQLQGDTKSQYDLSALRALMGELEAQSQPGDVVFTDDWDIFPVFFFVNHRNHYIVGLDPKFTHAKDPALWERYVRISRGQVPGTCTVTREEDGHVKTESLRVELADIRDYFGAKFVIVDRDHKPLAEKLDRVPEFAERIFPPSVRASASPPFMLYEIRD